MKHRIFIFLLYLLPFLAAAQSKPFSTLPTITPTTSTELATATGGPWKKFQITALKPILSAGVRVSAIAYVPTATGNSSDLNSFVSHTDGRIWFIDHEGDASLLYSPPLLITEYSAGNGAIVRAQGAGITFSRTNATTWVFSIPAGVQFLSFYLYNQGNPGASATLTFDYTSNTVTNQDALSARPPNITGWRLGGTAGSGSPGAGPYQAIPAGVATANTLGTSVSAVGSGDISLSFSNYSTALQANQTALSGTF